MNFLLKTLLIFALVAPKYALAAVASADFVRNANHITKGTIDVERLPTGTSDTTVAIGDDVRFETVSVGKPPENTTIPENRALIWIE